MVITLVIGVVASFVNQLIQKYAVKYGWQIVDLTVFAFFFLVSLIVAFVLREPTLLAYAKTVAALFSSAVTIDVVILGKLAPYLPFLTNSSTPTNQ